MGIFRAIGLIIFLVALAVLLPAVFTELSRTIIVFLQSSQTALAAAGILASHASSVPFAPVLSHQPSLPAPSFIPPN